MRIFHTQYQAVQVLMFQDSFLNLQHQQMQQPLQELAVIVSWGKEDGSGNYELIQFGVSRESQDIVYLELMSHMYLLQEIMERLRKVITLHILMIILYRKAQQLILLQLVIQQKILLDLAFQQ